MSCCFWCSKVTWPWQRAGRVKSEWWHVDCHRAMQELATRVLADSYRT